MYNVDLSGKVALVTGGSRGIGKHIAEALQLAGGTVLITGRDSARLEEAAADIGDDCRTYVCDQRDAQAIKKLAADVAADFGPLDILVNNAGVVEFGTSVSDTSPDTWNEVIETNLTGVFLTTQAFLSGMITREHGDIFMIGSTRGKVGDAGWAAYCASKFGLQGFSQSLLQEVRGHNIRVFVLNPGTVSKDDDIGATEGIGIPLHAADLAATIVHLSGLPRRTLVHDLEIWGTNP